MPNRKRPTSHINPVQRIGYTFSTKLSVTAIFLVLLPENVGAFFNANNASETDATIYTRAGPAKKRTMFPKALAPPLLRVRT